MLIQYGSKLLRGCRIAGLSSVKIPAAMVYGVGKGVYQPLSQAPLDIVGRHLFIRRILTLFLSFLSTRCTRLS